MQLTRFWSRAIVYRGHVSSEQSQWQSPSLVLMSAQASVHHSLLQDLPGVIGWAVCCRLCFSLLVWGGETNLRLELDLTEGSFCRKSFGKNADRWVELLYIGEINRKVLPAITEMVHAVWVKCRNNAKNRLLCKFLLPRNLAKEPIQIHTINYSFHLKCIIQQ